MNTEELNMVRSVARVEDGTFVATASTSEVWDLGIGRGPNVIIAREHAVRLSREARRLGTVSASTLIPRKPLGESLEQYLAAHGLIGSFAIHEIVNRSDDDRLPPPEELWPNIVATLALGYLLRDRMIDHGARGLNIAAAYRPSKDKGAKNSRHRGFFALDLDLLRSQYDLAEEFAAEAAKIFAAHQHLGVGVGTYGPKGSKGTIRVHLDAGTGDPRPSCWQKHGAKYVRPSLIKTLVEGANEG